MPFNLPLPHSMSIAKAHLVACRAEEIEDLSKTESFDFKCRHDGHVRLVEVKGTTGSGDPFLATEGEVALAKLEPLGTWLIVVFDIDFAAEALEPKGGTVRSFRPTHHSCSTGHLTADPALAAG